LFFLPYFLYIFLNLIIMVKQIMPQKINQTREIPSTLYQNTIDAIDSIIHMVNTDLKILLANKELFKWIDKLGTKSNHVIGKHLYDIFPFLPQKIKNEYQQVFKTGVMLITEESIRLLGETIRTKTRKIPIIENGKVENIVTMITDITYFMKDKDELKAREAKFRQVFEQSNDAIFLLSSKGIILDCNQKTSSLLGYSKTEIIGKHYEVFVVKKYHEDSAQKLNQLRRGLQPLTYEKQFLGRGGEIIPVEINPTPILDENNKLKWIQSVVRDITERKNAEHLQRILIDISEKTFVSRDLKQLFQAIHEILGQLINVSNFYIAIYDPHTEILSFPYFIDQFDDTPQPKKLGKGLTEYVLKSEKPLLLTRELSNKLEKKKEVELIGTDCVSWLGIPLKTSTGETFGVLVVQSYDEKVRFTPKEEAILMFVSQQIATAIERKKTEKTLHETEIQFHHLQKIESIGTLVGSIAHDYNNILTAIMGNAQMLEYNLMESDTNSKKYVNAIIKASESAAGLVQQLLAFTKEEEQLFEVISLNRILTEWVELLRQIAGDIIKISLTLTPSLYSISGNPEKIRQIIMNLVINASEAMPRGGDIFIETKNVDFKKNQYIKDEIIRPGCYTCLTLTDTGIGIEEDIIDEIFKPFVSKKKQRKGTGLGLSIVKRIVDEMNAFVTINSKISQGTSISIFFPRFESLPKKPSRRKVKAILQGSGEIILIVDDDKEVRTMLKSLLEDHLDYSVLTAKNGKEALKILAKDKVSLVITDLKMPDMDGIDLFDSIKQKHPYLEQKVIAVTAFSENHESNLIDLGFRDVIKKPLKVEKFSIIIRKILEEKKR